MLAVASIPHIPAFFFLQEILLDTGVGTRGAGGAWAPLKFVKGGLSPPEMNLVLKVGLKTYLKVGL